MRLVSGFQNEPEVDRAARGRVPDAVRRTYREQQAERWSTKE
jgi:hypothetical protein